VRFGKLTTKRAVPVVGLILVSLTFTVFATVILNNPLSIRISETASYADTVTIYQNGFTFVTYRKTVEIQNETERIQFYFPAGALTETLRVQGISILEIRFSQETHPLVEKGDIIAVHTEEETYIGTFISWDRWLLIQIDNKTVQIPPERITAIELNKVVEIQGPQTLVEVLTDAEPGEYTIEVSYLIRGPAWRPVYHLDLNTSHLECWAIIENVENWGNVTLTVVSGGPHVVYRSLVPRAFLDAQYKTESMSASQEWTPTQVDEYHEYTLDRKITFQKGTTTKLPLFEGAVKLRQEYFWSGGEVVNRYHINNTLSEPLATGIIEIYRNNIWRGEDQLEYTPVKGQSTVIVNYAYDIKIQRETVKEVHEYDRDVWGIQITIRNFKDSQILIVVQQSLPYRSNLLLSNPEATVKGSALIWTIEVYDGETSIIYYEYETLYH
jgi:hypothetical protein